ncbi:MAG: iron-sulfur cluster-binding protein [Armatimonadetes bacterium]|nr:iron-sulfur cluster-binding protein [Armatimonadota bacterium]
MNQFDDYVKALDPDVRASVRKATTNVARARERALSVLFEDAESARLRAMEVKSHVLDNLRGYLLRLEERCVHNGIVVHWASTADEARILIGELCLGAGGVGETVVKAKSMATEEIHLNEHLEGLGLEVVETDLGEFVVQLDHDTPSHIVAPIIHKDRHSVSETFQREGLGPQSSDPATLAGQARDFLREKFKRAKVGISGINFAIAETGRLVLVENEGNNRLSTTAPKVHIAVMGIEKVLPRESDLPLFLKLLAGSATGQLLTVYTHLIHGPRKAGDLDGPDEVHLVILDNGRSKVMNGPYREILRCIRCGACLNACPVYRASSGHAYGHVYSGPLGAVLGPALEGVAGVGTIAKASTLCGACEEVCPVKIPIPAMLLKLRSELKQPRAPWLAFQQAASSQRAWSLATASLPVLSSLPNPWTANRERPQRQGRDFRRWWDERA